MLMALPGAVVPAHLSIAAPLPAPRLSPSLRPHLNISGRTDAGICVSGTPVSPVWRRFYRLLRNPTDFALRLIRNIGLY